MGMSVVVTVVFGSWVCNICQVRQVRPHTSLLDVARAWDKLLSLVTPWMMMTFVRWRMVRHVLSVVRTTNVVHPGVPSSLAGSMRTT